MGTSEVLFPGDADIFVAFRCFDNVREVYPIRAFLLTMKVWIHRVSSIIGLVNDRSVTYTTRP